MDSLLLHAYAWIARIPVHRWGWFRPPASFWRYYFALWAWADRGQTRARRRMAGHRYDYDPAAAEAHHARMRQVMAESRARMAASDSER